MRRPKLTDKPRQDSADADADADAGDVDVDVDVPASSITRSPP
jgi:hypothetical protein